MQVDGSRLAEFRVGQGEPKTLLGRRNPSLVYGLRLKSGYDGIELLAKLGLRLSRVKRRRVRINLRILLGR